MIAWISPTAADSTYAGIYYDSDEVGTTTNYRAVEADDYDGKEDIDHWLRLLHLEELRDLARMAREPILPVTFYLVFMRPFLARRRILRCNRHGVGLHMRRK